MKQIDWTTSRTVAIEVDARVGECVANAARAMINHRDILPTLVSFVEGFWMKGGQLGGHVWLETPDAIIDPTLVLEENTELRETTRHHPVSTYTEQQVLHRFSDVPIAPGNRLPMLLDMNHPHIRDLMHQLDPP
jgi:hypothetical protein